MPLGLSQISPLIQLARLAEPVLEDEIRGCPGPLLVH